MPAPRLPLLNGLLGDEEVEALLGDEAQLQAMLTFERALAEAEAEVGLIGPDAAAAIGTAIDSFTPDWDDLAAGLARDGVVVPALVRQLRAQVAEPHRGYVHYGATSQDVVDTALMLQLARVLPVLLARMSALQSNLEAIVIRSGSLTLMAHTRMQAALPITVADKVGTWLKPLVNHTASLSAAGEQSLMVQLGGPVGNRSSFGGKGDEVAREMAKRLDLMAAEPWHTSRAPIVALGSLLSLITGALGKFGADVALMAQNEIGAVTLVGGGGSSAMPHKSNPVNAEVLVALARHNAGLVATLHQSLIHENERSGAAWTLEWLVFPQMIVATSASLRLANQLARQMILR